MGTQMPDNQRIDLASRKQADLMAMQLIEGYRDETEAARYFDEFINRLSNKVRELNAAGDVTDILLANTVSGILRAAKTLKEKCVRAAHEHEEEKKRQLEYRRRARWAAYYYVESVKLAKNLSMEPLPEQLGAHGYGNAMRKLLGPFRKQWDEMTLKRWKEIGRENGLNIGRVHLDGVNTEANEWEMWEHTEDPEPENEPEAAGKEAEGAKEPDAAVEVPVG